jgi:hypothetical protein
MAVKTFAVGELATSSDVNTFLANAGLVWTAVATPTPATTIGINSCFSAVANNYRVIVTPVSVASSSDIDLRLRVGGVAAAGANYYQTNIFSGGGAISSTSENGRTAFRGIFLGAAGNPSYNSLVFDIFGPFQASPTRYQSQSGGYDGTNVANRSAIGFHSLATSYDGFELVASSNITATITVYAYRMQ